MEFSFRNMTASEDLRWQVMPIATRVQLAAHLIWFHFFDIVSWRTRGNVRGMLPCRLSKASDFDTEPGSCGQVDRAFIDAIISGAYT